LHGIRLHRWRKDGQTVVEKRFPGELETLRADNMRVRRSATTFSLTTTSMTPSIHLE
jgi:hypothetical protein